MIKIFHIFEWKIGCDLNITNDSTILRFFKHGTDTTSYALTYHVTEKVETRGLSSTREICLFFKDSQSMKLLKHFLQIISFIKNKFYLISAFLLYFRCTNQWNVLQFFFKKRKLSSQLCLERVFISISIKLEAQK